MAKDKMGDKNWIAGTDEPTMLDIMVVPHLTRSFMLKDTVYADAFKSFDLEANCPTLSALSQRARENEKWQKGLIPHRAFLNLVQAYRDHPEKKMILLLKHLKD